MKKLTAFILSVFLFTSSVKAEEGGINFVDSLTNDIITNVLSADTLNDDICDFISVARFF